MEQLQTKKTSPSKVSSRILLITNMVLVYPTSLSPARVLIWKTWGALGSPLWLYTAGQPPNCTP